MYALPFAMCAFQVTAKRASTPSAQLQGLDPQQQRVPVPSPAYSSRRLRGADHTYSILAGPHLYLTHGHVHAHTMTTFHCSKTAGQHALTHRLMSYTGAHHTQCCLSFECHFLYRFSQGKRLVTDVASYCWVLQGGEEQLAMLGYCQGGAVLILLLAQQ